MKNIKLILSSIVLLFFLKSSFTQTTFQKFIPTGNGLGILSENAISLNNKNHLVYGSSGLMCIDTNQSIKWKYLGINFIDVKEINNNGFIVASTFAASTPNPINTFNILLLKLDSTGDTLWTKSYIDSIYGRNTASTSINVTTDGGFLISANIEDTNNTYDAYFIKVDSNGIILWTKIIDIGTNLLLQKTKIFSNGNIVSIGNSDNLLSPNGIIINMNSNGQIQWITKYTQAAFSDIIYTLDSGFAIIGSNFLPLTGKSRLLLLKTDEQGQTRFTKTYGQDSIHDEGTSIRQLTDSNFVLLGRKGNNNNCGLLTCYDNYIIKVNQQGDTLWTRLYGDNLNKIDVPVFFDTNIDGGFTIISRSNSFTSGTSGTYIIKTDSLGLTGNCNYTHNMTNTSLNFANITVQSQVYTVDSTGLAVNQIIQYTQQNITGANTVTLCTTVGIDDNKTAKNEVTVFPNPGSEQLTITGSLASSEFQLYDLVGKLVFSTLLKENSTTINTAHLPQGTYIYRINSKIAQSQTGKWIKN